MPVITIDAIPIALDKKRKIVDEITETISNAYDLPKDAIAIFIRELETENIGRNGKLLSDE